jgi:biopolymer transport protein ExbD/biopolymer transport protein TolR
MTEADRDDAVLIAVTRDGQYFLGQDRIGLEELAIKVGDMVASRLDKTVYIRSDFRAKYGNVVQVVDTIRAAGVDRVGLLTERLDDAVRQ